MMKRYINFTGWSENVDFLKIFSNIRVLFCSKLMTGQLNIDSKCCGGRSVRGISVRGISARGVKRTWCKAHVV